MHDGFNVVSWEESSDAVADTFEPAVIIFLDDVDDGSFHEGQLIFLILGVVVDGHNWEEAEKKCKWMDEEQEKNEGPQVAWLPLTLTFL